MLGRITTIISGHTLSGLNVTVTELCGFVVTFVTDAPKALRVPIAANGSFSYDKTVVGDHLGIKGRLRGNRAVGTFFDSLSSGTLGCSMAGVSPFTAKH